MLRIPRLPKDLPRRTLSSQNAHKIHHILEPLLFQILVFVADHHYGVDIERNISWINKYHRNPENHLILMTVK